MFEDLSRAIREEVVLTLFHVEVQREDAERQLQPVAAPEPVAYEHESVHGAEAIAAAGGGAATALAAPPTTPDGDAEARGQRAPGHRSQRPVLVRLRQEVQALPRRIAAFRRLRRIAQCPTSVGHLRSATGREWVLTTVVEERS